MTAVQTVRDPVTRRFVVVHPCKLCRAPLYLGNDRVMNKRGVPTWRRVAMEVNTDGEPTLIAHAQDRCMRQASLPGMGA